jgi:hypothetical protein
VAAAFIAGITTMTLPGGRCRGASTTASLDVDRPTPPGRDLDSCRRDSERREERGGTYRRGSGRRGHYPAPRRRTADRIVKVGVAGKRPDQAVEPAEDDLTSTPVAHALNCEVERAEPVGQSPGWDVDQMARGVEREPVVAERSRLETVEVRGRNHQDPTASQQAGRALQLGTGIGEMLERVPEDDRRPAVVELLEATRGDVGTVGFSLDTEDASPASSERVEQRTIAGADVEDRTVRGDAVEPAGELAPRTSKDGVAKAPEAA